MAAGANLDLVLHLKPYLKKHWAHIRARRVARTGAGAAGDALERSYLRRIVSRTLGFPDPSRSFDPTRASATTEYDRSHVIRLDGRREDPQLPRSLMQMRAWSYLSTGASRVPQLVRPGLWAERMPMAPKVRRLRFGDELHGITLYPTGFDGGSYGVREAPAAARAADAMDEDDATPPTAPVEQQPAAAVAQLVLKGRVPAMHGVSVAVAVDAQQRQVLEGLGESPADVHASIDALPVAPLIEREPAGAVSLRWVERSGSSSASDTAATAATAGLRSMLPHDCTIVAVGAGSAADAIGAAPTSSAALAELVRRLCAGDIVRVAPPPLSMEELLAAALSASAASADGAPPLACVSGVPAPRLRSSGRHQKTAQRAKTPAQARRLRLASPPWPIDWSSVGDSVPAWLWTRAHDAPRSREAGHGLPRMGQEDLGVVAYHKRHVSIAARRDADVAASASARARRDAAAEGAGEAQVKAAAAEAARAALAAQGSWRDVPAARLEQTERLLKAVLPRFAAGLKEQLSLRAKGGAPRKPREPKGSTADVWRGRLAAFRLSTADPARLCARNTELPLVRGKLERLARVRAARAKGNLLLLEMYLQGDAFDFARPELRRGDGGGRGAAPLAAAATVTDAAADRQSAAEREAALEPLRAQYATRGERVLSIDEESARVQRALIARRKVYPINRHANDEQAEQLLQQLEALRVERADLRNRQAETERRMDTVMGVARRAAAARGATVRVEEESDAGSEEEVGGEEDGEAAHARDAHDDEDDEE